jgi:hypothetical protein
MRKYKYDYYTIKDLGDLIGPFTKSVVLNMAIDIAKDRAKYYCFQAEWTAILQSDDSIKVRRKRYVNNKSSG